MLLLKIIKRGLFDFPTDIMRWFTFYLGRKYLPKKLKKIETSGFQVLNDLVIDSDLVTIDNVGRELLKNSDVENHGQLNGRVHAQGLIDNRLTNVVEKLKETAVQYLGSKKVCLELTYFQVSKPEKKRDDIPGGSFHMDDNKPNLKFFIYLSDVGVNNGPLRFIPGTHGLRSGKILRYFMWTFLKRRQDLYADPNLMKNTEFKSTSITGLRGLSVAVDTTGWHKADLLLKVKGMFL